MLCIHLADQDVIGGGREVKSDHFGARLAGFWSKIVGRLLQPHAIATKDAKRPNALASAGWIPARVASAKWLPWLPQKNPARQDRDSASL